MPPLALVKASNDGYCPPYVPVLVVFGGTSGIGKAMTRRLAEQLDGRVHVIVVGRNKAAADALFASLPKPNVTTNSTGSHQELERCGYEFIHCDISLMKNVHQAAEVIAKRCPKINYLILTSGKAFFGKRKETEEGLDSQLVLRYYWKFVIINDLLPNLRSAKDIGQAAGVFVILIHGIGPKIDFQDLEVRKYHWYGIGPLWTGASYGDLMLAVSGLSELCHRQRSIEGLFLDVRGAGA
jgi:NAD(P)-dependent dehydrogenase (short-subunit alcohol dehydrogenase family)